MYFIITTSIKKTNNSPPITYVHPFHKNIGKTYRSRGNVITEADTHDNNILVFFTGILFVIPSFDSKYVNPFRFFIMKRRITNYKI